MHIAHWSDLVAANFMATDMHFGYKQEYHLYSLKRTRKQTYRTMGTHGCDMEMTVNLLIST